MIVMGIDPSLTSTGMVALKDGEIAFTGTTKNRPDLGTIYRVTAICDVIINIIKDMENLYRPELSQAPDLIVIEGFSYGSKGRSVFDTAYLGWRIREELERLKNSANTPWIEVTPSQLKKFATSQGTAPKEIILQQIYKRWGVELHDNNQGDAFVLAKIGEAYLSGEALPSFQQEIISALKGEKPAKKNRKKVKPCD